MKHGSQSVTFYNKEDTEGISRSVLDLLSQLEPQGCILVEKIITPPDGESPKVVKYCIPVYQILTFHIKSWNKLRKIAKSHLNAFGGFFRIIKFNP